MSIQTLVKEIHRRDAVLSVAGWWHVFLLFCIWMAAPWDNRLVLGLNPWIKPMKFAVSVIIFLWTMAWFQGYLSGPALGKRIIRWGTSLTIGLNVGLICVQAARGVPSHFNTHTAFDSAVFAAMGLSILLNSFVMVYAMYEFIWQPLELEDAYLLGIRIGLFLFAMGSLEGMLIVLHQGHTVGAADGGAGLAFLNWSTKAGDLRIAHAMGLHSLQILPLAGFGLCRWLPGASSIVRMGLLVLLAVVYTGIFVAMYLMAAAGKPLMAG